MTDYIRIRRDSSKKTTTDQKRQPRVTWVTKAMVPLMRGQNGSVTVSDRGRGWRKAKGIQHVYSTMAAASSNHSPAAILHTTRRMIKYNLTVEVGELTHRHKAHRETWNVGTSGYRKESGREVIGKGDREWSTISNANASGVHAWMA